MSTELFLVLLIIGMALVFDFLNGMNDAANSIATIVSTRVLAPRWAVAWAAFFNFVAAFGFGTHVAKTIGKGIVHPAVMDNWLLLSALVGAVVWTYLCTQHGLPISVSHALIGGMVGGGLAKAGLGSLVVQGLIKIAIFIIVSPVIGLVLGTGLMIVALWVVRGWTPHKVDTWFRRLQLASAAAFSLGHGTNDAQKTMGIIAAVLFSCKLDLPAWLYDQGLGIYVPFWIVLLCHFFIGMGTLMGGWRVVETLGMRVTKLQPIGGCCAESACALTLFAASLAGIPVSTTHTITGGIMGVGAVRRLSAVRWGVAQRIVWAWLLTIPCSAVVAAVIYYILIQLFC